MDCKIVGIWNCFTFRRLIACIRIAALLYSITRCRKILLYSLMVVWPSRHSLYYKKQTFLQCRNVLLPNHLDHVHIFHGKSIKICFNIGTLFYLITVVSYFSFVSIKVYNIDMFLKTYVLEGVGACLPVEQNASNSFLKNDVQSTVCIGTTK
jgi:hypothetical protein